MDSEELGLMTRILLRAMAVFGFGLRITVTRIDLQCFSIYSTFPVFTFQMVFLEVKIDSLVGGRGEKSASLRLPVLPTLKLVTLHLAPHQPLLKDHSPSILNALRPPTTCNHGGTSNRYVRLRMQSGAIC